MSMGTSRSAVSTCSLQDLDFFSLRFLTLDYFDEPVIIKRFQTCCVGGNKLPCEPGRVHRNR